MNILIVESENDQYFVQALINKMLENNATSVISIHDFVHSSLDKELLTTKIESILSSAISRRVSKIGIILDIDDSTKEDRIGLINSCFAEALNNVHSIDFNPQVVDTNTFVSTQLDEHITVKIACYFTNVGGSGELETILKEIKVAQSHFADCLIECWKPCVIGRGKTVASKRGETGDISEKELLKLWVDFYKRYDTLSKSKRDEKSTDWKGIWLGETTKGTRINKRAERMFDLDSPILDEIKQFLSLFIDEE